MNRRQKKKAFKKRFGFNPPRNMNIKTATRIMEHKEIIIAAFERLKAAILNLWEQVKKQALELAEALKEIHTAFITPAERRRRQYIAVEDFRTKLLLRQQEREAKQIEGNSDIYNNVRGETDRTNEAF